ncbi:MAG TPA: succinate dehydrogenase cytochrome b subunit [Candidatus Corynebacterium avicola]|uniref:Succinate dehydrogenase cytochrome b subunit n=1 Tax=Candidatus Corynebacterium avicola TaxID=2838527 RepID=A0A9D1RR92_9CORY|nr:succinate dehydrogenase cytochrome b subunit [Candidatus Corynebacterium avicola]
MTVKFDDPVAIEHGKISIKPLREKPGFPTWAMKLTMAVTGLIFAGFVLVHMIGNLKVFAGAQGFDHYAHFLRDMGYPLVPHEFILWCLRVILAVSLILHVYCAFALKARAKQSRGEFKRTGKVKGLNNFTAGSMLGTGAVLLLFIIFHILDLTLGKAVASSDFVHLQAYNNLVASFERPAVAIFYILCMIVLFLHLSHGIWTASSDLGITGHRTRQVVLWISYLLPAAVMIGNIAIPLAVLTGIVS